MTDKEFAEQNFSNFTGKRTNNFFGQFDDAPYDRWDRAWSPYSKEPPKGETGRQKRLTIILYVILALGFIAIVLMPFAPKEKGNE